MWEIKEPIPVKLIVGILAANDQCLPIAVDAVVSELGPTDLQSDIWPFTQTNYYQKQTGKNILRQFLCFAELIDPGELARIKNTTNRIEQHMAKSLDLPLARPINLDPGIIEPSKLVLATTKNYSHRIYIGENMYAEVTLTYDKGYWKSFYYTYPDYKEKHYHDFFTKVRDKLVQQLKATG